MGKQTRESPEEILRSVRSRSSSHHNAMHLHCDALRRTANPRPPGTHQEGVLRTDRLKPCAVLLLPMIQPKIFDVVTVGQRRHDFSCCCCCPSCCCCCGGFFFLVSLHQCFISVFIREGGDFVVFITTHTSFLAWRVCVCVCVSRIQNAVKNDLI